MYYDTKSGQWLRGPVPPGYFGKKQIKEEKHPRVVTPERKIKVETLVARLAREKRDKETMRGVRKTMGQGWRNMWLWPLIILVSPIILLMFCLSFLGSSKSNGDWGGISIAFYSLTFVALACIFSYFLYLDLTDERPSSSHMGGVSDADIYKYEGRQLLKSVAKDPRSVEVIGERIVYKNGKKGYEVTYRAKNGFGGYVIESTRFELE